MRSVLAFLILAFASSAHCAGFVLSAGYAHTGESLSDLTGGTKLDLLAGGDFHLLTGAVFTVIPSDLHRFEIQVDVGYASAQQGSQSDKNKATWSRIPVEIIYFYRNTQENFRFGYGPAIHLFTELRGEGELEEFSSRFANSVGWTVVFDKLFLEPLVSAGCAIGLKYNSILYHSSKFNSEVSGNALLVTLSVMRFD